MLVDCVTLQLPKVHDPRGNLTFVEGGRQIPFDIRRVYYLCTTCRAARNGAGMPIWRCTSSSLPCRAASTSFWMTVSIASATT